MIDKFYKLQYMKLMFNRILACSVAILMMAVASCEQHDADIVYLDVSPKNLEGDWEQQTLNGEKLEEGTYFRISFDRSEQTYCYRTNLTSVPESEYVQEGIFKIYTDVNGAYIRGISDILQDWNNMYYVRNLTPDSMKWVAYDTPDIVMTFRRVD